MKLKINFNATQVLEFKNGIKLTLKAIKPEVSYYIEELNVLASQEENLDKRLELGREYVKRVISCTVKELSGIELEIDDKPFQLTFKQDQKIEELDDLSYNVLMEVFTNYLNEEIATPIFNYYNDKSKTSSISINEDKKKDL